MRFQSCTLQTEHLQALKRFYTEVLDQPLVEEETDAFAVQIGATRLRFEAASGGAPFYHLAFNIPENQLAEAKVWLERRVPLLGPAETPVFDFPAWNAHSIYFYDPAGTILELIARHDLPNASSAPFGGASLLSISEVGLPCPDVAALSHWLEGALDAPLYSGNREHFAAVGDPEGLLIVVSAGRHWLPTEDAATISAIALDIEGPAARSVGVPGLPYRLETRLT